MSRWLVPLALVAAIAAVIQVVRSSGPDCGEPFDTAAWREATTGSRAYDDGYVDERMALVDDLLDCGRLENATLASATRLLGRPPRDVVSRAGGETYWDFYLRPSLIGVDAEKLTIEFGRSGRVVDVDRLVS